MAIVIGRAPLAPPANPHPRLVRLGREVGAQIPLLSPVAPRHRSYWYHFTGSFDQPADVAILKELIFWASIHQEDCLLRVVHATPGHEDYLFHQKIFDVTESPCLVMSDRGDFPTSHVKLTKEFFAPDVVGEDYSKLRGLLDAMHSLLTLHGSVASLSEDLLHARVACGLTKVWTEMKGMIKLTVSPQPSA
jgi:hypothetical protein